jgi:ceramide glucosyltransferase
MNVAHIFLVALAALAAFGIVTSIVYSLMVAVGVARFRVLAAGAEPPPYHPPVSILKAVHGDEPDLEENLASFFVQDYPEYEILFCARHDSDLGLAAARRIIARYPDVKARILTCGEPPWPNARTFSLEVMRHEALYPILVASDSDVSVGKNYLRSVVQPLLDPHVGMVTCLYRGVAKHGIWAQLEALGMSVEMTGGVLVANMLEGMQFALGPSMVMRQSTVEKIGGFEKVAQYYADDFVLGNFTAAAGEAVVLSSYIVEHHVMNSTFKCSMAHQQAWATSTRFSRPAGHFGEVLTYAVPFGLLALLAFGGLHHFALGLDLFLFTVVARVLLCLLVSGFVVHDRAGLLRAWLYPLRDVMGLVFWVRSYLAGRRLRYRGEPYELLPEGRLRKLAE